MKDSLLKAETRHYSAGAADRKGRMIGPFRPVSAFKVRGGV